MDENVSQVEYKKLSIAELELQDEDLRVPMTMALIISGTWLDLMSLKNYFNKLQSFRIIYNTISTAHLRVVNVEDFERFQEWKRVNKESESLGSEKKA